LKRLLAAGLCLVAPAVAGCGEDQGGEADNADLAELAAYLPQEDVAIMAAVDVAAIREDLGLPDDADAAPTETDLQAFDLDDPELQLIHEVSLPFPVVLRAYSENFDAEESSPLDGALIDAAAGGVAGVELLSVVHTAEPWDEIAGKLEDAGYKQADDIYVAGPDTPDAAAGVVADAGDGVVVFAAESEQAEAVLARADEAAEPSGMAAALDVIEEPARAASTVPAGDDKCVKAVVAGESGDGATGTLAFLITGEDPDPERFDAGALDELDVGEPTVEDQALLVPLETPDPPPEGRPLLSLLISDIAPLTAYECP